MAIGGNQVGKNMSTDARVKNGMSKGSKNSMQSKIIGFATRKIKNRAPSMTKLNTISIKSSTIDQPCPQTDSKPPAEMIQRNGDSAQTDSKPPAETNQKNKNGAKTDSKTPADMIQGNENCAKTDPKPPADMIQRNENGTKTDLKPLAETIQRNANQSGSNVGWTFREQPKFFDALSALKRLRGKYSTNRRDHEGGSHPGFPGQKVIYFGLS